MSVSYLRGKVFIDLDFAEDCTAVELKKEYTDYSDAERYALVSTLSETELYEKYGALLDRYKPFVVITPEMADVICAYWRNERKHKKRQERGHLFPIDEDFDEHHPECVAQDTAEAVFTKEDDKALREAIHQLTDIQQKRLVKHFFYGMSYRAIAAEEGVNHKAIQRNVEKAINFLKKLL